MPPSQMAHRRQEVWNPKLLPQNLLPYLNLTSPCLAKFSFLVPSYEFSGRCNCRSKQHR
jgi:hypothetical protein